MVVVMEQRRRGRGGCASLVASVEVALALEELVPRLHHHLRGEEGVTCSHKQQVDRIKRQIRTRSGTGETGVGACAGSGSRLVPKLRSHRRPDAVRAHQHIEAYSQHGYDQLHSLTHRDKPFHLSPRSRRRCSSL